MSDDSKIRSIVVLISGSGTNLQALIDATSSGVIPNARISLVISNRKAAYGLVRAANASIPTDYLALQPYLKSGKPGEVRTRVDYDVEVAKRVLQLGRPDLVVLAGWMHVLSAEFLEVLNGERDTLLDSQTSPRSGRVSPPIPIINLHPALPGAFDGANAIQRAYEAFQRGEIKQTGLMIHRVVKEVDRGEPLVVKTVDILPGETEEELENRIHVQEHIAIVEGVNKVLSELS
ncbi:hypothetical protein FRC02_012006 [Tulasnella sp. 418]|nr:hypothetical protein FRC02_012006 [Tulasnella sp. 418]